MATKANAPNPDRTSELFQQLTQSAARLNAASDEFSRTVAPIDAALKKLNLGVAAWHKYMGGSPDADGDYWSRELGYARVQGKWGLALRTVEGNVNDFDDDTQTWLFNDAPRMMRVEAIDHIPALLEELVKQSEKVATELHKQVGRAAEFAETISSLADTKGRR
jgi:hypothetical protein